MRSRPLKAPALLPALILVPSRDRRWRQRRARRSAAATSRQRRSRLAGRRRRAAVAFDPRDAPLGCILGKGLAGAEGPAPDRPARHPAGRRAARSIAFASQRGRGAGSPDRQRGARRRGDRPAPADRRRPLRRRSREDRDLPAGAGHQVLMADRVALAPHQARRCCSSSGSLPIAGVVWWATKQQAPTFPHTFGGRHGARRRGSPSTRSRR